MGPGARLLTPPGPRSSHLPGCHEPQDARPRAVSWRTACWPSSSLPSITPWRRGQIIHGRDESHRPAQVVDIPACVWVSVDEDREAAETALAHKLVFYGPEFAPYLLERVGLTRDDFAPAAAARNRGDTAEAVRLITPPMLRLGIAGTPEDVVERCTPLVEQGATHLSFGPPLGPDPLRAVELLGQQVIPELREMLWTVSSP